MVHVEDTPNPLTLKFIPEGLVAEEPIDIKNEAEAKVSYLAQDLFKIDGVTRVFLGRDFISVSIKDASAWAYLKLQVQACIEDYYSGEAEIINYNELSKRHPSSVTPNSSPPEGEDVESVIKEIIEMRIRPAVAMDGGDVLFKEFKDGIVYLKLFGACSGCPSADITLKNGIENMLCYFVPEVQGVVAVEDDAE